MTQDARAAQTCKGLRRGGGKPTREAAPSRMPRRLDACGRGGRPAGQAYGRFLREAHAARADHAKGCTES
eukprot:2844965-Lingulodinium_polyedra.AAC.1